jgi:hypothetical protein
MALAGGGGQVRACGGKVKARAALQDVHNRPPTVRRHSSAVLDLAFCRDGRRLVAGYDHGQVAHRDPLHPHVFRQRQPRLSVYRNDVHAELTTAVSSRSSPPPDPRRDAGGPRAGKMPALPGATKKGKRG